MAAGDSYAGITPAPKILFVVKDTHGPSAIFMTRFLLRTFGALSRTGEPWVNYPQDSNTQGRYVFIPEKVLLPIRPFAELP